MVPAASVSGGMATAAISGERVFFGRIMAGIAYIAATVSRLISLEVVEALGSTRRQRSHISVTRIEAVVDMAEEAVRTVEPRASSDKHSAHKPIGPIVAVGSAVVGGVVEISVGTHGSDADLDRNLGFGCRCRA